MGALRADELDDTSIALPRVCERCQGLTLLRIAGLCADCIGHIGLHEPAEHAAWHVRLTDELKGGLR